MDILETLKKGDDLFFTDKDKYFSTTFYHNSLPILLDLQRNSYSENEEITHLNVSFYSRAVNALKHLKLYKTSKGRYFNAYGQRVYLNDMYKR